MNQSRDGLEYTQHLVLQKWIFLLLQVFPYSNDILGSQQEVSLHNHHTYTYKSNATIKDFHAEKTVL